MRIIVPSKRLRILVVETNPHHRTFLVFYLVHQGHWVESEAGVGSALSRLHHDGFDVLLTAVWRPDAGGWSLLGELRKRGELPPRVVTMCALPRPDGPSLSRDLGAQAHLAVPFPLSELNTALG